jgi:polysaccharide chain length determinant protein (PEP-CTERM system associated)
MNNTDATKTVADYTSLLRRRWHYLAVIIPAALLVATFLAFTLPVSYRASGTIMIEPSSLPANLVQTTVTGSADLGEFAEQQLELARRRVMTTDNLTEIVKQIDPYPDMEGSIRQKAGFMTNDTSVEPVDPISLEPMKNSGAFSIYYDNPDPKTAQIVAGKLIDLFLTFNQRTRAEQAGQAYEFLQTQAHQLEGTMREMERKLATFRGKYGDALPQAETRNLAGMDRAQREVESLQREIRLSEEKESLLEIQLSEVAPSLTAAVGDWRTELAKMRSDLAIAEQKYSPEHPDVRRLRRAIADLAAQGGASGAEGASKPDNPEYIRIQKQLYAARRELDALRESAARARADMSAFEGNLAKAPTVEPEYVQISRDYENAQASYKDLQSKMKAAALAQTMEVEAKGERFALIRPPSVPTKPASPNRLGILLLGALLGAAIAVGAAVLVDASDPTVRSAEDLAAILDDSPMGAIPTILNRADRRQRILKWAGATAAFAFATIVVVFKVVTAA